jgi:hypothetical protein
MGQQRSRKYNRPPPRPILFFAIDFILLELMRDKHPAKGTAAVQ